jgi:hypothetical protein
LPSRRPSDKMAQHREVHQRSYTTRRDLIVSIGQFFST